MPFFQIMFDIFRHIASSFFSIQHQSLGRRAVDSNGVMLSEGLCTPVREEDNIYALPPGWPAPPLTPLVLGSPSVKPRTTTTPASRQRESFRSKRQGICSQLAQALNSAHEQWIQKFWSLPNEWKSLGSRSRAREMEERLQTQLQELVMDQTRHQKFIECDALRVPPNARHFL